MAGLHKKSGLLLAALIFFIIANIIIWGYVFLHRRGGDDEVLQLWDIEDLLLEKEGEFNSLLPGPSYGEPDEPEEFRFRIELPEVEQP